MPANAADRYLRFSSGASRTTTEDRLAVEQVLRGGWLASGAETDQLEQELAEACSATSAVVVSSATAALTVAFSVGGVGTGDEVITSALSFPAAVNAIAAVGAKPVFVDTLCDGSSLDPDQVVDATSSLTAAILPVGIRGEPTDTDTLSAIAGTASDRYDRKVILIEDGAYSLGAERDSRLALTPAAPVVISMHPTKMITCGLGGAILGLSAEDAETARALRNQGFRGGEAVASARGFAFRMSDMNAALGRSQLRRIGATLRRRRTVFDHLLLWLDSSLLTTPSAERVSFGLTNCAVFGCSVSSGLRDDLRSLLANSGIPTGVHYPLLTLSPLWESSRKISDLMHSKRLASTSMVLPSSPDMSASDCDFLITAVDQSLSQLMRYR